jgi:hypothetical protein
VPKIQLSDLPVIRLEHYRLSDILDPLPTVKVWFKEEDWRGFTYGDCRHSLINPSAILEGLDCDHTSDDLYPVPEDVDEDEWRAFTGMLMEMGHEDLIDLDI